ncbi:Uncharacterized protein TCM_000194 [Theobroma cacao]|uniref:Uncharacterized protein n=1 Tax=Theobroma cacao TaxID=3641 RepID=A0A061DFQ8_THECC|nr:Uncharacterized protein TCM_000194 [Theobroma cacao]
MEGPTIKMCNSEPRIKYVAPSCPLTGEVRSPCIKADSLPASSSLSSFLVISPIIGNLSNTTNQCLFAFGRQRHQESKPRWEEETGISEVGHGRH